MIEPRHSFRAIALAALTLALSIGCKQQPTVPDYARPLPPGQPALRQLTGPQREAILVETANQLIDPAYVEALGRSVDWFRVPSSRQFFPIEGISHQRAEASVNELLEIAEYSDARVRSSRLLDRFDVYESVGYDGSGIVFFTGYYSPEFTASRIRTGIYQYPLYTRPADLVSDPKTGAVLGQRQPSGAASPYPTRSQIETGDLLKGAELVYLPNRLDAYTIEVNGSAKLKLTDGGVMYVGYAGTNGREYTSIGRLLVADGILDANTVSMPAIRSFFLEHPKKLDDYIRQNERFVFFQEYPGTEWPAGSLGFKVTPRRSVATDKKIFPRGGAVMVSTTLPSGDEFRQLMMDQDTGGAIRAPGRADLYFGIGASAERISGAQAAEGRLFYLFVRP